jgi:HlyD family secretion protein
MKKWIIIAVVAIVLGVIGYLAYSYYNQTQDRQTAQASYETVELEIGSLTSTIGATGTVRSKQSADLAWKTSGTVGNVHAFVGDQVESGETLSELEQTSLSQNVILAQADLVNAQQQLDNLLNSQTQSAQALKAVEDAEQALEDAHNPELAQARALQAIADAEKAVEDAQRRVNSLYTIADNLDIDIAKAELALAEKNLDRAEDLYEPYENKPETNLRRAQLLSNLAKAQQQYDNAVRTLNAMTGTGSAIDKAVADANLATAQAQLLEAQREYERVKGGATPGDITLFEARLADAEREWQRLKDGPTTEDIASAQARVAAAEATLSQAWIEAPFTGTITIAEPNIGDQVGPNTFAFRLDDLSTLYVDLDVSEIDINQVAPGQQVTLTFDAIRGKEYNGEVVEVGLIGTEIQGVVTFVVTIELTDADADIRPGMTSAVDIVVSRTDEALLVPNQAIRTNEGMQVVFILDSSGKLTPVAIKLGASSSTLSEVLGGDLKEGDRIVINPKSVDGIEELNFFSGDPEDMRRMRDTRNQFEDNSGIGGE